MYRWVDHTGELELAIDAPSEEAAYADALAALAELLAPAPGDPAGQPDQLEVTVEAGDRAALLAEWLSELLYLADTEGFVPERVVRLELLPGRLHATVAGRRGNPSPLVKAVTYHRLALERGGRRWRATVTLDV